MSFAEPRPHRRPFNASSGTAPLLVKPKTIGGNLALTSITASSQDGIRHLRVLSKKAENEILLLNMYVQSGQTLHIPLPHPIMIGVDRTLEVSAMVNTGALLMITVVGYEWNEKDTLTFLFKVGKAMTDLFRRTDP